MLLAITTRVPVRHARLQGKIELEAEPDGVTWRVSHNAEQQQCGKWNTVWFWFHL